MNNLLLIAAYYTVIGLFVITFQVVIVLLQASLLGYFSFNNGFELFQISEAMIEYLCEVSQLVCLISIVKFYYKISKNFKESMSTVDSREKKIFDIKETSSSQITTKNTHESYTTSSP